MSNKSCGTCTKCCEGWLEGDAHGHAFSIGKPCYFLIQNKGCTIYDDRPEHPCKSFKCAWLADESIPDWVKPDNSEVILMLNKQDLILIKTNSIITDKVLQWIKDYSVKNKLKLII